MGHDVPGGAGHQRRPGGADVRPGGVGHRARVQVLRGCQPGPRRFRHGRGVSGVGLHRPPWLGPHPRDPGGGRVHGRVGVADGTAGPAPHDRATGDHDPHAHLWPGSGAAGRGARHARCRHQAHAHPDLSGAGVAGRYPGQPHLHPGRRGGGGHGGAAGALFPHPGGHRHAGRLRRSPGSLGRRDPRRAHRRLELGRQRRGGGGDGGPLGRGAGRRLEPVALAHQGVVGRGARGAGQPVGRRPRRAYRGRV